MPISPPSALYPELVPGVLKVKVSSCRSNELILVKVHSKCQFVVDSVYMSTPISQFIPSPPFPLGIHLFSMSVSLFLLSKQDHLYQLIFIFHIHALIHGTCFSLFKKLFTYWLRWVFIAARGLCLVAAIQSFSSLRCTGFSLWWLLLA